jgi:hypothetical protein
MHERRKDARRIIVPNILKLLPFSDRATEARIGGHNYYTEQQVDVSTGMDIY